MAHEYLQLAVYTPCHVYSITLLYYRKPFLTEPAHSQVTKCRFSVQYLDLFPDPDKASCMSVWNRSFTASYLSDNAEWHHMAVTWTKADNGRMRIFKDGLMMSEVRPLLTD